MESERPAQTDRDPFKTLPRVECCYRAAFPKAAFPTRRFPSRLVSKKKCCNVFPSNFSIFKERRWRNNVRIRSQGVERCFRLSITSTVIIDSEEKWGEIWGKFKGRATFKYMWRIVWIFEGLGDVLVIRYKGNFSFEICIG